MVRYHHNLSPTIILAVRRHPRTSLFPYTTLFRSAHQAAGAGVNFLRAAAARVFGLFVGDWLQSAVVLVIIAAGWFTVSRFGPAALVVLVALLAGQLVWFARAEARRTASPSPRCALRCSGR